jgi:hypothetical protein
MHFYKLKVFLGYKRTLDPRGVQTFEGRNSEGIKGIYVGGGGGVDYNRYYGHCMK